MIIIVGLFGFIVSYLFGVSVTLKVILTIAAIFILYVIFSTQKEIKDFEKAMKKE